MLIKQLSVFVENQKGKLAETTDLLRDIRVDIRALTVADTTDFGILRLIVSDPESAAAKLREQGFSVSLTDVIGVEIPDAPGALAGVLDLMDAVDVNVEYLYAFLTRRTDAACVILRVDDNEKALRALHDKGVRVVETVC